ncbi:MAG: hypothetical protein WB762_20110 [Candidatus Sulfotelmatobacter sp.]
MDRGRKTAGRQTKLNDMTNDGSANLMDYDLLTVVISREQIEAGGINHPLGVLRQLLRRQAVIKFCEQVEICVTGFDDDPRELYEMAEVRNFVSKLDAEFPYWLYFLTKRGTGLSFILSCLCPPFLTPEEERRSWNERIADYLLKRGFPALDHICRRAECSEEDKRRLTDRITEYLLEGPDVSEV